MQNIAVFCFSICLTNYFLLSVASQSFSFSDIEVQGAALILQQQGLISSTDVFLPKDYSDILRLRDFAAMELQVVKNCYLEGNWPKIQADFAQAFTDITHEDLRQACEMLQSRTRRQAAALRLQVGFQLLNPESQQECNLFFEQEFIDTIAHLRNVVRASTDSSACALHCKRTYVERIAVIVNSVFATGATENIQFLCQGIPYRLVVNNARDWQQQWPYIVQGLHKEPAPIVFCILLNSLQTVEKLMRKDWSLPALRHLANLVVMTTICKGD